MISKAQQRQHAKWLSDVTVIPTAAGHERRVVRWVKQWVAARSNLVLTTDPAGNLLIHQRRSKRTRKSIARPLWITAHMDHPAFVVQRLIDAKTVELEFRGGVHDPYFRSARIEIIDQRGQSHEARITELDRKAKPFKRVVAKVNRLAKGIMPGDIGRWRFAGKRKLPRIESGFFHTHACDDLAALAAALSAVDMLRNMPGCEHVGVLLTRAEEVGFIGAIAACEHGSVSKHARLLCLENSRSFAESPIGGGPIVRVGDRMSVFEPTLTNAVSMLMMDHAAANPNFKWQRKLMPGGTCEATTFSAYGFQSTCLCLPLGNYHNMQDIDAVVAGRAKTAKVGPEFIAMSDYHGLIEMLVVCATRLDSSKTPTLRAKMEQLYRDYGFVLGGR
jgi:endoglucanase